MQYSPGQLMRCFDKLSRWDRERSKDPKDPLRSSMPRMVGLNLHRKIGPYIIVQ